MILQAESKKEYEEVSLKKVNLFSLLFISVMCAGTRMCEYRELSELICVVFIFGRVLGYICHSWYQSASGALM